MEILDKNGNPIQKHESKRVISGVLGIILGALGIHKFILGYTAEGIIMLLLSVLTCGIGAYLMGLIGLIEGIIYLTKSDEEFIQVYQVNKKGWF
jgi:TM2 domain-containing membrane protein YozV